jgi:metallo-beta-lactamase family protein
MSTSTSLRFLGAAGTVTGSKFLVETAAARILVDAGLFQGEKAWRARNWEPPPVAPESLDAVVVTHAHLDHCGYLPVLAREGFGGPVLCTAETAQLAAIVLRDAAHLQEEEARWARETGLSRHADPRPLYDTADAEKAIALLRPVPRHEAVPLAGDMTTTLHRAGHILGASFVAIENGDLRIVFSGDLGRPDHPLLRPPEPPGRADVLVVESTYGDRGHAPAPTDELAHALTRILGRGGSALIPAFAIDRTPLVLHVLRELVEAGRIPDVPVYVDSPMAMTALEQYRLALRVPDSDFRPELRDAGDPFDPGRLQLVHGPAESEKLNSPKHPCIVISASGMATGGRVLHHLEHQLPHGRNGVVLVGYQVPGTRGRALADGARAVKIHGRHVPVRAEVVSVRGYSAHADVDQTLAWLADMPAPDTAYVVHGEPHSAAALVDRLVDERGWNAVTPAYLEKVRID